MLTLLLVLFFLGLLDSLSNVPIGIVPLVAILGGRKPILGAVAFLAGMFGIYTVTGFVILLGLDLLTEALGPTLERIWNQPDPGELLVQLVIGGSLLVVAWKIASRPPAAGGTVGDAAIPPVRAFTLGVLLTVVGLPGAIPYVGAVDQILRADVGLAVAGIALLFYNLVFILPLASLLVIRLIFPAQSDAVSRRVNSLAARWGRHLMVASLLLIGGVLIADGIGWFFGHPLLPVDQAFATELRES